MILTFYSLHFHLYHLILVFLPFMCKTFMQQDLDTGKVFLLANNGILLVLRVFRRFGRTGIRPLFLAFFV